MMVAGSVSAKVFRRAREAPRCVRGEELIIPRSVLDLLFDALSKAKHRELGIVSALLVGR